MNTSTIIVLVLVTAAVAAAIGSIIRTGPRCPYAGSCPGCSGRKKDCEKRKTGK